MHPNWFLAICFHGYFVRISMKTNTIRVNAVIDLELYVLGVPFNLEFQIKNPNGVLV